MTERGSPLIERLDWGRVHTSAGSFRDVKLWPGGGRGWDWNETGTHHIPGVQAEDVIELLDKGSRVIVIGCGQNQRLEVTEEAKNLIASREAEAVVLESNEAVDRYNELARGGAAVGALVHSTC